jgi:hypothetical protein
MICSNTYYRYIVSRNSEAVNKNTVGIKKFLQPFYGKIGAVTFVLVILNHFQLALLNERCQIVFPHGASAARPKCLLISFAYRGSLQNSIMRSASVRPNSSTPPCNRHALSFVQYLSTPRSYT